MKTNLISLDVDTMKASSVLKPSSVLKASSLLVQKFHIFVE